MVGQMSLTSITKRWRELSGQNNWKNLLDPLDLDLRRYLIHYGERAQATYDTFVNDQKSVYAGSSKYAKKDFFARVGLEKGNPYKYSVVKYLYATSKLHLPSAFMLESMCTKPWCEKSNWIGYVAVATDKGKEVLGRRDILVAWRGTIRKVEWAEDFNFPLVPAPEIFGKGNGVKVHRGWLSMYTSDDPSSRFNKTSARDQVLSEVKRLLEEYKNEDVSISVTGHSLGASLATLNAADIGANVFNKAKFRCYKPSPVTAFAFACPRVGNSSFRDVVDSTENLHMLRVRNVPDLVPRVPPRVPPFLGYVDVGQELLIDTRKSNYLNYIKEDTMGWHNLEASYLHGIAGTHGVNGEFKLEVKRDIALCNKYSDLLKDKYLVPGYWWLESNKGMVQQDNGSWMLQDHEDEDDDGL